MSANNDEKKIVFAPGFFESLENSGMTLEEQQEFLDNLGKFFESGIMTQEGEPDEESMQRARELTGIENFSIRPVSEEEFEKLLQSEILDDIEDDPSKFNPTIN